MPTVEICLSPALISNFDFSGKTAVVVDVIRATSIICAALEHGVEHILPVATKDETFLKKKDGYLIIGEKSGEKIAGFDLNNSPSIYSNNQYAGHKLAMSTTNGTKAILMASAAQQLVIGAFLNITALSKWLGEMQNDIIIFCAGWKDKINVEDTLFAGNLTEILTANYNYNSNNDGATIAQLLYDQHKNDMYEAVMQSSQRERIIAQHLEQDTHFCLQKDYSTIVPILEGSVLVDSVSLSA